MNGCLIARCQTKNHRLDILMRTPAMCVATLACAQRLDDAVLARLA